MRIGPAGNECSPLGVRFTALGDVTSNQRVLN